MGISIQDPVRLINVMWYTSLFLAFVFMICAIAFGSQNDDGDASDSGAVGFAAVWTMLLVIAMGVGGTFVLRKFKTPLAVGFLLGVVIMMAVNMLVLTALLDQENQNCDDLNDRLSNSVDYCLAEGCQKAVFAVGDIPDNQYADCCRLMQAYKYGSNPNVYAFNFGAEDVDASWQDCAQCNGGECDASVAAAVFAVFLFITYSAFGIALGYYRGSIISAGVAEETAEDTAEKGEESSTVAYPVTDPADVEMSEQKDLSE